MSLLRACAVLQTLRLLLEVPLTAVKYGRRARGSTSGRDGASGCEAGAGTVGNEPQMRGGSVFPGSPDGLDLILDLEGLKGGGGWLPGTRPRALPGATMEGCPLDFQIFNGPAQSKQGSTSG